MSYIVESGTTIIDAAFNITGSLAGIDPVLEINTPDNSPMPDWNTIKDVDEVPESNFMESYTPHLKIGQILNTDGLVVYNLAATNGFPFNSSMMDRDEINDEIDSLISKFNSRYIPMSEITVGDNLRGAVIYFDPINDWTTEDGTLTAGDYGPNKFGIQINQSFPLVTADTYNGTSDTYQTDIRNMTTDQWDINKYTFPNDRDYLVTTNSLPVSNSDENGWDKIYIAISLL